MMCHRRVGSEGTRDYSSIFQGLRTADTTFLQWGLQTGPCLCNFGCMPGEWRNRFFSMHEGYDRKKRTHKKHITQTKAANNGIGQRPIHAHKRTPVQTRNRVKIAAPENMTPKISLWRLLEREKSTRKKIPTTNHSCWKIEFTSLAFL